MVSAAYLAALLAVARGVVAQAGLEQCTGLTTLFPACATSCVLSAASAVGCTNGLDLRCRCDPTSSAQIQASAFGCVLAGCNADPTQIESAINAGASVCACVSAAPTAVPSEPPISSAPAPSSPPVVPSEPAPSEPPSSGPPPSAPSSVVVSEEPSVPPVVPSSTEPASSGPITPAPSTPGGGGDCDTVSPCEDAAQAVPNCGRSCIISAASASLGCAADDYECQCAGFQTIQAGAAPCVISACGIAGAVPLLGSVSALCGCVTANPSTPCTASSEPSITLEPSVPVSSGGGGEPPVEPSEAPGPGESSEAPEPGTTAPPTTCAPPTAPDCGPIATSAVPACAQPCFSQAAPNVGCDVNDYACQCEAEAQASLTQLLVPCVATACPAASLQAVITGASSVCACAAAIPTGTGEDDCPGGSGIPQPSGKPTDDYPVPGEPTHYPEPPHASETPCPEDEEPEHPEYPAPEPEHPAPEPEHPEPEHPVPEPETPAPEPETPAPEPETPEEQAPTPTQVEEGDDDVPVTVSTAAAARSDLSIMGSLLGAVLFAAGLM
ncbi:hypothetical protein ACHAQH_004636 [Verticillium albo-atrum]